MDGGQPAPLSETRRLNRITVMLAQQNGDNFADRFIQAMDASPELFFDNGLV